MQTRFSPEALAEPWLREADRILRNCVHCGFCNATCPTYRLLGDERDGPRGRIYLMKALLEAPEPSLRQTVQTRLHLDRCLTCRNCETTCPSGVEYGKLVDIGRARVEAMAPRPWRDQLLRLALRKGMAEPRLAALMFALARPLRALLPPGLRAKIPPRPVAPGQRPPVRHQRTMLILEGCVQPGLAPNTNAATARVLDRLGISLIPTPQAGCCGALEFHLNAQEAGLDRARTNIEAWWPLLANGAEAIVQTASGCGLFVKDYGHLLADDPVYAERAAEVSRRARDLVEVLRDEPLEHLSLKGGGQRLAFHCPCTLQHGQKLGGAVEAVLDRLGFHLTPVADPHLCCGSAGTYSVTQPELAQQLRDQKLRNLEAGDPELIVTANIGCQAHLAGAGRTPVRHWIEVVDAALTPSATMSEKISGA